MCCNYLHVPTDLKIGFEKEIYTVPELDGMLYVAVIPFYGNVSLSYPIGVRITSKDETAIGKHIIDTELLLKKASIYSWL